MTKEYVSRGGLKLESVAETLELDFKDKIVLDVGSSTGGFSDYALQHGAKHIIAVERGVKQMHSRLKLDKRIDLLEKTDIRDLKKLNHTPDMVVIDVSFVSLRQILPAVGRLVPKTADIVAMVKPQFESSDEQKHEGIIKNDRIRRDILKNFEEWVKQQFVVYKKADSGLSGATGNLERFYLLRKR
jgi:23S rRNA (cytidine1920-2'-O)/16S rRNA (cytidine1409-2'-O)-methyltransferase